jgi:hypothetical protein
MSLKRRVLEQLDLNQLLELGGRFKVPNLNARMQREELIIALLKVHGAPGELDVEPGPPNPQVEDDTQKPIRRRRSHPED